jgi:peptide deformylase
MVVDLRQIVLTHSASAGIRSCGRKTLLGWAKMTAMQFSQKPAATPASLKPGTYTSRRCTSPSGPVSTQDVPGLPAPDRDPTVIAVEPRALAIPGGIGYGEEKSAGLSQKGLRGISSICTLPQYQALLRQRARRIREVPAGAASVIAKMREAWKEVAAYGIAAPQVGDSLRTFIYRPYEDEQAEPLAIINPKIIRAEGELKDYDGCLSVPGIYGPTRRAAKIEVIGWDESGQRRRWRFEGFTARIIQHEIDHLEGVLFIDRIDDVAEMYTLAPVEVDGEREWQKAPLTESEREFILHHQRPLPPFALKW